VDTAPPTEYAGIKYPSDEQWRTALEIIRRESEDENWGYITINRLLREMGIEETDEVSWLLNLIEELNAHPKIKSNTEDCSIEFEWREER
jgi:hypothetical protein